MTVHRPVVAGSFYPADPAALAQKVGGLLARAPDPGAPPPKALILPHAGYRFSGAAAAAGVITLREGIRRVVVLGPSHRHAFQGVALPDADAVATPLGEIPLDTGARTYLSGQPDVHVLPQAHAQEHSIEVELPFLQERLGAFTVVPLVVGDIAADRLAEIIERLWGGPETLIVISTDLTHFLTAGEAEKIDLSTAQAVERGAPEGLGAREACGHRPLAAFLKVAARRGMRLTRLALTHSGKVTGDNDRVVGYGAWMAHEQEAARLSRAHRHQLLRTAKQALAIRAAKGRAPAVDLASFDAPLQSVAASFVTLTLEGRLRGCIGSLVPHRALAEDVASNAVKAGFEDPRFKPITAQELAQADIEVAVLSHPADMTFRDEADLLAQLRPTRDGLILTDGRHRGTFLPKVWEALETPEKFLSGLKVKAGLPRDHWSPSLKIQRYVTETFRAVPG